MRLTLCQIIHGTHEHPTFFCPIFENWQFSYLIEQVLNGNENDKNEPSLKNVIYRMKLEKIEFRRISLNWFDMRHYLKMTFKG